MVGWITIAAAAAAGLASLAGSEWAFDGAPEAYIQFGTERVAGSGGCNRIAGSYTFDGTKIAFTQMISTMMGCAEEVMVRERVFLEILEKARSAEATHTTLVLKDETGAVLATLKRRDWD